MFVDSSVFQAGARGITVMSSSGDGGVSGSQPQGCSKFIPTFPAALPWITAIGGTTGTSPEVRAACDRPLSCQLTHSRVSFVA